MSKYVYLGTKGKQELYYNETKDEFYSAEKGYFAFEMDKDICLLDEFKSRDQDEKEKAVLITDPNEIKALKCIYANKKAYENKKRKLKKAIKNLNKKAEEATKEQYKRNKRAFYFSVIFLTYVLLQPKMPFLVDAASTKMEELLDDYHVNHQNDEAHLASFYESVQKNSTMSDDLKEVFNSIFLNLVKSDAYITDSKVRAICHRLENFDFKNYNESTYSNTLPLILFGEDNSFNSLVSTALDESANNREETDAYLFGLLNIGQDDKLLTSIFTGGEDAYIENLARIYNTKEDNIRDLLNTIRLYKKALNPDLKNELKESFYQKFRIIILDYYRDKDQSAYREVDYLILSSQLFDGDFTVNYNMFSDKIIIHHKDPIYGEYDLYYDAKTGKDMSYSIYYGMLVELIKEKGENLDYNDPDSRFLIYLVTLAYSDLWESELDEFANCQTAEDLAKYIINNVFYGNHAKVDINPAFLYGYLSNGKINLSDIISEINRPNNDALSIALFKEFDHCLRIDLDKGDISYDKYNAKLTKIYDILKEYDENLFELLSTSITYDTSFLSSIKLVPFEYTLKDGDIKKTLIQ